MVLNFTQEFVTQIPSRILWIQTGRLYNIIYVPLWIQPCHGNWAPQGDTCHGLSLVSSAVCQEEINSNVEQGNTRMLFIGIIFVSVEIKWLRWCKKLTITILTTQSVTDLLNNQDHYGLTLNWCEQKSLVSIHSELKQKYVPQIKKSRHITWTVFVNVYPWKKYECSWHRTVIISRYTWSQYKYSRCRKTIFVFESNISMWTWWTTIQTIDNCWTRIGTSTDFFV